MVPNVVGTGDKGRASEYIGYNPAVSVFENNLAELNLRSLDPVLGFAHHDAEETIRQ